jgi:hypothetical protein
MRIVAFYLKIFEAIFENGSGLAFDCEARRLPRFALQLLGYSLDLVEVNVAITARPYKVPRLKVALVSNEVG